MIDLVLQQLEPHGLITGGLHSTAQHNTAQHSIRLNGTVKGGQISPGAFSASYMFSVAALCDACMHA